MRPRTAPSGILASRRSAADSVDVCADAGDRSQSIATTIGAAADRRGFRQGNTACVAAPSTRNPLDKTRVAQSLDENRLTGSLRFSRALIVGRDVQSNKTCFQNRSVFLTAAQNAAMKRRVGLDRSRPAYPRHFAQGLLVARSPGRGVLAHMSVRQTLQIRRVAAAGARS